MGIAALHRMRTTGPVYRCSALPAAASRGALRSLCSRKPPFAQRWRRAATPARRKIGYHGHSPLQRGMLKRSLFRHSPCVLRRTRRAHYAIAAGVYRHTL